MIKCVQNLHAENFKVLMEKIKLGIVVPTCNPSSWETEAGGSPWVQGQPGLCNKANLRSNKSMWGYEIVQWVKAFALQACNLSLITETHVRSQCGGTHLSSQNPTRDGRCSEENRWTFVSQLAWNSIPETEMPWLNGAGGETWLSTAVTWSPHAQSGHKYPYSTVCANPHNKQASKQAGKKGRRWRRITLCSCFIRFNPTNVLLLPQLT